MLTLHWSKCRRTGILVARWTSKPVLVLGLLSWLISGCGRDAQAHQDHPPAVQQPASPLHALPDQALSGSDIGPGMVEPALVGSPVAKPRKRWVRP